MSYTKVVKRQWHRDWSGEDILCDDVDVFILTEAGSVYIEQDGDEIMLTTQQAIELVQALKEALENERLFKQLDGGD